MNEETRKILNALTIDEKAALLSQITWETTDTSRFALPGFLLADGPSGLRKLKEYFDDDIYNTYPCTCYPSPGTCASSWDRSLLRQLGQHLGEAAEAEEIDVLLGPGVNIKRSPLGGRNFEYYSEDPYVTSELATEYIKGLQEHGTGACIKHFAVNNQETRRMSIDARIDEETLHELYLKAFEKPVKEAKPAMVMTAYNQINGEYCAEHSYTLAEILRGKWHYDGCVVTDCYAAHDLAKAIKNGLNLQMPGESETRLAERIHTYLETGELTEEQLDQAVAGTIEMTLAIDENRSKTTYDKAAHHEFARLLAAESMVLLKNEDDILPLVKGEKLAVIGEMAKKPRFQGGGSSHVNPWKLEDAYTHICSYAPDCTYAAGYTDDQTTEALLEEAGRRADEADKVILFIGLPEFYESEGYDRTHLRLPEAHVRLLETVSQHNQELVVVLSNGAPVEMPWLPQIKGLLETYLPGEAGGSAIAALLFGEANPCGKLAETFPLRLEDTPCYLNFPGDSRQVEYREGVFIGYRYYDSRKMKVLFPFGYGLSYTRFRYNGIIVRQESDHVNVSINVTNTGDRTGKEIIQLYIKDIDSDKRRPEKELKAFDKVLLAPGETKEIQFRLEQDAFAHYEAGAEAWIVRSGRFHIQVGASSRDIRLTEELQITGSDMAAPEITASTAFGDMVKYPKTDVLLGRLLKEHPKSYEFYCLCKEEDPLRKSMGALMSFHTLKRVDGSLHDHHIQTMLEKLNE